MIGSTRLLSSLMLNAVKFTADVELRLRRTGNEAQFTVPTPGIGTIGRVHTCSSRSPGRQLAYRSHGGVGLGLTSCPRGAAR
jgi:signal transduction histidine kinase